jgi:hypothetical protein
MTVLQYDPKQVSLIIGGHIVTGFADDDFIEVERDEDAFTKKTGVDGITTRAKVNTRTGHLTVRLMQSSASNDILTGFALKDEASNGGQVPILCKDGLGRSVFSSESGWVKKFPKSTWKKDVNQWEWTIETGALDIFLGGN